MTAPDGLKRCPTCRSADIIAWPTRGHDGWKCGQCGYKFRNPLVLSEERTGHHTPGPWHVGPHYGCDVESSEGRICECRPFQSPRAHVNAMFIAAAPDLADSLIEVVALYDCARDLLGPDVRHKLERAEAALRKAGVRS